MLLDSFIHQHFDSVLAFTPQLAPAFKTYCIGEDIQGISVDYALPKNGGMAPPLNKDAVKPLKRMRYSHFGCNVVHEDIAYALGVDTHKEKMSLKHSVELDGGKLPAEHGHGTEYHAPKNTQGMLLDLCVLILSTLSEITQSNCLLSDHQARWMKMDPLNVMNPGVGGLPTTENYK